MTGIVFDIKRFAVHDGPGIRTTVFLKGCPMRCLWCHNPESIEATPCMLPKTYKAGNSTFTEVEELGRVMSVDEVMQVLRKEKVFMDESGGGVTFSGGEPLFQPVFLLELLKSCKTEGMHTVVDTSGYASQKVIDSIRPDTDLFLYDLKLINSDEHFYWTGVQNSIILANFDRLINAGAKVRVRIPLIPGVNLSDDKLEKVFAFLEPYQDKIDGVDLLPFHGTAAHKYDRIGMTNRFDGVKSLPVDVLESLRKKYNLKQNT
jgi:pyruvate formate lyase activating enzyme